MLTIGGFVVYKVLNGEKRFRSYFITFIYLVASKPISIIDMGFYNIGMTQHEIHIFYQLVKSTI